MKVLWFEVTEPCRYSKEGTPIGGWQDSLESIVRQHSDVELYIAFISTTSKEIKKVDGVTYLPMYIQYSFNERHFRKQWDIYVEKMLPAAKKIVNDYNPDIIHVFGTEWPFGQIANFTEIPVIIHIQGAIVPYNNALYPPGYSIFNRIRLCGIDPRKWYGLYQFVKNYKNWEDWEKKTWKSVSNYMGRTEWDRSLSALMHPGRYYYHVDEALRPVFLDFKRKWKDNENSRLSLFSTGCGTFWKGPDMLLKVAKILKESGVEFEWNIAGKMSPDILQMVEHKEKTRFEDNNINIMGFVQPTDLCSMLCSSSMYIHTAYIENSPNSICEAQCLGVPIVSTNVGGISSLIRNGIDGVLVPANDPWQMANAIIELAKDKERKKKYSIEGQKVAMERHGVANIYNQLLNCYKDVLRRNK